MPDPIALAPKPTAADENRADCVRILRERLAEAERGEIEALILIAKHPDGSWSDDRTGCDAFPAAIGRIEIIKQRWIERYLRLAREE